MAPRDMGDETEMGGQNEECPICHSTRYTNKEIRFVISMDCYHKMCTNCMERLTMRGPVPCPIIGCKNTIRKHRFRNPTFSDLKLEKEVDIRRVMAKTFNRREEDFESLRDWNDYLAKVEDMTFNLVNGIEVEETEQEMAVYRKEHLRAIEENKELEEEGAKAFKAEQEAQLDAVREKRQAVMQEQEREKHEQQAIEQEYLRRLQAGDDPAQLAYERSARLEKASARKKQAMEDLDSVQKGRSSLLKGLRKKKAVVEELPPIDPFGGMPHQDSYFSVSKEYPGDRTFANFDRDAKFTAGGYDKQEWYRWALLDAFAGLGVAIEDEEAVGVVVNPV